jgi:hypothetical protein
MKDAVQNLEESKMSESEEINVSDILGKSSIHFLERSSKKKMITNSEP